MRGLSGKEDIFALKFQERCRGIEKGKESLKSSIPKRTKAIRWFKVPYFSVRAAMLDLNQSNHPLPLSKFDTHP